MLRPGCTTIGQRITLEFCRFHRFFSVGNPGDGAGKGGGGGGSIRSAGGAFGRMAVSKEEEYFHRKQLEDLRRLGEQLSLPSSEFPSEELKKKAAHVKREMEHLKRRLDIGEENESDLRSEVTETHRRAHDVLNEIEEAKKKPN